MSRAKRVTHRRPQFVVHASSMCVVGQLWLLAAIGQYSLMICPHSVPCPGRRERRSFLPWGMMVRGAHTFLIELHSSFGCFAIPMEICLQFSDYSIPADVLQFCYLLLIASVSFSWWFGLPLYTVFMRCVVVSHDRVFYFCLKKCEKLITRAEISVINESLTFA